MREITISANDAGRRLDRFLRKYLKNATLGEVYRFIRKDVKVGGKRKPESYILEEGDVLTFYLSDEALVELTGRNPEDGVFDLTVQADSRTASARRNFDLVYEDDQILIASKPYGLLTHGDSHEKKDHLANRVKDYLIACGAYNPRAERVFTPAPVNRLDRNTTGIVLFGKSAEAMRELTRMIRNDEIRKFYLTIAHGEITDDLHLSGTLVKNEAANKVYVCSSDSVTPAGAKHIETIVRPQEVMTLGDGFNVTLCEVELLTGRSHQIRAHLSAAGHPLVGDGKYALRDYAASDRYFREQLGVGTQLLHACRSEFVNDISGAEIGALDYLAGRSFESPLPGRFTKILEYIRGQSVGAEIKVGSKAIYNKSI